ncbi:MAG: acyltransferase family protein [Dysgonamonadaceae bacterium]|jgi:fucose 4-O-acetylase-like acetyltransferase|nr:acyltransferase family protein [Dysgonamonadaceae bacterium]
MKQGRIAAFDMLKGVGIILVIVGHNVPLSSLLYKFIFSFHMPLFFLVSGYFFRPQPVVPFLKKDFKQLIVPYLFVCAIIMISALVEDTVRHTWFQRTIYRGVACFWGSGSEKPVLGGAYPAIGAVWFLLALFWCRAFFNYFYSNKEKNNAIMLAVAIGAILVAKYIALPFSILQGLSAIVFYYIGYLVRKYQLLEKKVSVYLSILMAGVWIFCILFSHCWMESLRYRYFPLDVLSAVSGTWFIYRFCRLGEAIAQPLVQRCTKILVIFGQLSLVVLCFHVIEMFLIPWRPWINDLFSMMNITLHPYLSKTLVILCRLAWAGAAVVLVPKVAIFRRIFSIKADY